MEDEIANLKAALNHKEKVIADQEVQIRLIAKENEDIGGQLDEANIQSLREENLELLDDIQAQNKRIEGLLGEKLELTREVNNATAHIRKLYGENVAMKEEFENAQL